MTFLMEGLVCFTLSMMREFFESDMPSGLRVEGVIENRIKGMILRGLFDEDPILTRRMIIYSYLQESLLSILGEGEKRSSGG